jgi:hypothetical protein
MDTIFIGNDSLISVPSLVDSDGAPITSASVEATLLDMDTLVPVPGITWPVSLSHSENGNYEGIIDKSVQVVRLNKYILHITATSGTADAEWNRELMCVWRQ